MKVSIYDVEPGPEDNVVAVEANEFGVTLFVGERGKFRAGHAFRVGLARLVAEEMLKCADAYDAAMAKKKAEVAGGEEKEVGDGVHPSAREASGSLPGMG